MPASCMCEGGRLLPTLREDLDRYVYLAQQQHAVPGRLVALRLGLMSQGLWATVAYRLNHYGEFCRRSRSRALIPHVLHRVIMLLTRIHIDPHAHIGAGLKFPHGGHVVIGPVRMGSNCDIYHGVTLGAGENALVDRPFQSDLPTLGDRVWVGPGAVVAGGVVIEDDAVVGANSLLVRDVPARGVVIGVPTRLVSRRGSFTHIAYRNMDSDDERKLALAADPEAAG